MNKSSIGHHFRQLWVWGIVMLLFSLVGTANPSIAQEDDYPPDANMDQSITSGMTIFTRSFITIPTYPYADFLYEQTNIDYNITYPVLDWAEYDKTPRTPAPVDYELLVLENDYVKVTILPELGGRVYQFIDKTTGHNHFYQNPVLKPTHWGPVEQGWWLAVGGVEWCLPVDEHGYEWGIPWSWSVITTTNGVTVTVRDTDQTNRLRAAIDIGVPHDRAYMVVTPHIENPTYVPITYKFWLNAQIAPGAGNKPSGNTQWIFNADEMAVHSTGDNRLPGAWAAPTGPDYRFSWPIYNGTDYSYLHNLDEWLGFFEYPQAAADFTGVYDHDINEGVVRIFPSDIVRGTKGFSYGWANPLDWHTWTDQDSSGVELHGGVTPTFWDSAIIYGWDALSWSEVWYPVGNLGSVTEATREAGLGLQRNNDNLEINLQTTGLWQASATRLMVWDLTTCAELADLTLPALTPGTSHQSIVSLGGRALEDISVAHVDAEDAILVSHGPTHCLDDSRPDPHLGYGINVRNLSELDTLAAPLGVGWIRLWDEYSGLPTTTLPYNVLYNINCRPYIGDMNAWGNAIAAVAQAGKDKVNAYEICNEPNVYGFWNSSPPDPARFSEMLCIANAQIKAVDPDAIVISGGLAPVGRIEGTYNSWAGHNFFTMDERTYLKAMLDSGAGACMDGFGYHPYGFAYTPETNPDAVSNGFVFRGAEKMHDILVTKGHADIPIWATEFNWLRRATDDGFYCDNDYEYSHYFKWQEVSAQTQADYLVRAFQYADDNWPWMHGMFVWNLDWHNYKITEHPCLHSRFYALRRFDGTTQGSATPAYTQFAAMDKRPGLMLNPELKVTPSSLFFLTELSTPKLVTGKVFIQNSGYHTMTWDAVVTPGTGFTPVLSPTSGVQDEAVWVAVDTTGLGVGIYTRTLTMTGYAEGYTVNNSPHSIDIILKVVPELERIYLPLTIRNYDAPVYNTPGVPHGPSKIGTHAIAEGGTLEFAQQIVDGGAHPALVKGLSFGYLCDVKDMSPETITIGRWSDVYWEALQATGDPASKAADYMDEHMKHWSDTRECVDYWEILNEVDPPSIEGHAWLGEFFIACMDIAEANEYKLALFSYSVGVPEIYEWEAIVDTGVFLRAQQGGHILSLHEYSWFDSTMDALWGEPLPIYPGQDPNDPSLPRYPDRGVMTGRYRHLYRDILIPRGQVIPLAITEANLMIYDPAVRDPIFLEEMAWYDDRLREDDYVLGMAIFTLGGSSGWGTFDYYDFLPDLANRVIQLKDE